MNFQEFVKDVEVFLYSKELKISENLLKEFYLICNKCYESPKELEKVLIDELSKYKKIVSEDSGNEK